MNRAELIAEVAERSGLTHKDTRAMLDAFLEVVKQDVAAGNKVQLLGFGTFEPRKREARMGKNPKTGEVMEIKGTIVPAFKAGKAFKESMPKPEPEKKASKSSKKK